jgi:hypothetical protein
MPYKHNEPRRHKIPKARYKVSNWREYDQALQQRGSRFCQLLGHKHKMLGFFGVRNIQDIVFCPES